jgi:hypothetical protein
MCAVNFQTVEPHQRGYSHRPQGLSRERQDRTDRTLNRRVIIGVRFDPNGAVAHHSKALNHSLLPVQIPLTELPSIA